MSYLVRALILQFIVLTVTHYASAKPPVKNSHRLHNMPFQITLTMEQEDKILDSIERLKCVLINENTVRREITQPVQSTETVIQFGQIPVGYWKMRLTIYSSLGEPLYFAAKELFIQEGLNEDLFFNTPN
ncbi:MAG: hypothetical protein K9N46_04680 [Candidatus Marinimicrobia bacterium]|nr:hypothetical protein [Candidatus Neomarinimicrobiota bacterium]MCF7829322.1 hypothetical protein [Candidatus Neomarinimicrobiota bacterium]MCF7880016.1 hypothetical protein [Candidatus Neomarinimicrobiota bacterium]